MSDDIPKGVFNTLFTAFLLNCDLLLFLLLCNDAVSLFPSHFGLLCHIRAHVHQQSFYQHQPSCLQHVLFFSAVVISSMAG